MWPPTRKRLLFTQSPVILRFFSTSFRRLKCSMRHTKVAWWLSAALVLSALAPVLAAGPATLLGACVAVQIFRIICGSLMISAPHEVRLVAFRSAYAERLGACFGRRPSNPPGQLNVQYSSSERSGQENFFSCTIRSVPCSSLQKNTNLLGIHSIISTLRDFLCIGSIVCIQSPVRSAETGRGNPP